MKRCTLKEDSLGMLECFKPNKPECCVGCDHWQEPPAQMICPKAADGSCDPFKVLHFKDRYHCTKHECVDGCKARVPFTCPACIPYVEPDTSILCMDCNMPIFKCKCKIFKEPEMPLIILQPVYGKNGKVFKYPQEQQRDADMLVLQTALAADRERIRKAVEEMKQTGKHLSPDTLLFSDGYNTALLDILKVLEER